MTPVPPITARVMEGDSLTVEEWSIGTNGIRPRKSRINSVNATVRYGEVTFGD